MKISNIFSNLIILFTLFNITFAGILPIHQCDQGHKCVYYRGGKLLSEISGPGWHYNIPLITSYYNIKTIWQTDNLNDVLCVSNQGSRVWLDIAVVNKLNHSDKCVYRTIRDHTPDYDRPLIFDYIPSEVAQFCKDYNLNQIVTTEFHRLDELLKTKLDHNIKSYHLDDCLTIKDIRIQPPKMTDEMRRKFELIELSQKEKEFAEKEKDKAKVLKEREKQNAVMDKEKEQATNTLQIEIQKSIILGEKERQEIRDEMEYQKVKKFADAERYRLEQIAQGNERLFSNPNYLKMKGFESAHNNAKIIIGDVPQSSFFNFGNFPA